MGLFRFLISKSNIKKIKGWTRQNMRQPQQVDIRLPPATVLLKIITVQQNLSISLK